MTVENTKEYLGRSSKGRRGGSLRRSIVPITSLDNTEERGGIAVMVDDNEESTDNAMGNEAAADDMLLGGRVVGVDTPAFSVANGDVGQVAMYLSISLPSWIE